MREYTTNELNKMSPQMLINLIEIQQNQLKAINAQLSFLTEQIALMNQRSLGRKAETSAVFENQLTFDEIFNYSLFWWMNITFMCTLQKTMTELSTKPIVRKMFSKTVLQLNL